jgi:hypothetical protein
MAATSDTLSINEARRMALLAQGLLGPRQTGGPAAMLRRLGGVQLDTISVLARSHELVAYARHGRVSRRAIEEAYWGPDSETFEYWSHAACLLPLEAWPSYAMARRARRARGRRWHLLEDMKGSCAAVVARLTDDGPLTARALGGAKRGGPWWDWSETKIAAEWLLDTGELVCRQRKGFQRVYDLAERAIPAALRQDNLSDEACATTLVGSAGRSLGVASVADLAAYNGVPMKLVRQVIEATGLVPVQVQGWDQPAYAAPGALEGLSRSYRGRSLLLSPFDSLLWDRGRTERLLGLRYRLEAYVPSGKRVYGYFAMPVLAGTRIVGLVDPGRRGQTLVAKHAVLHTGDAPRHVAQALHTAAGWVGCDAIELERVTPPECTQELHDALGSAALR